MMTVLVPLIKTLFNPKYDQRVGSPELSEFYPISDVETVELDTNRLKLLQHQGYLCVQYLLLMITTIVSMVLLNKTKWFFDVLPYVLALMNMCTFPFWASAIV